MDNMGTAELVDVLRAAAAQGAYCLAAGARRIESLSRQAGEIGSLRDERERLKKQVALLKDVESELKEKLGAVTGEKAKLVEDLGVLEGKNAEMQQEGERLRCHNRKLEILCSERDKKLLECESLLRETRDDLDWVLGRGVVGVADQVLDNPTFVNGLKRVKQLCQSAISGIPCDAEEGTSRVITFEDVVLALDDLISVDYASVLGLTSRGLQGLRDLCQPYDELFAGDTKADPSLDRGAVGDLEKAGSGGDNKGAESNKGDRDDEESKGGPEDGSGEKVSGDKDGEDQVGEGADSGDGMKDGMKK